MIDTSDLRAWFREDIAKVLASVNAASHAAGHMRPIDDAFQTGFIAALTSVALAFGVGPENFLLSGDSERLRCIFDAQFKRNLEGRD